MLQNLGENAITVLVSNAVFLGLFCLVPFTVGRILMLPDWHGILVSLPSPVSFLDGLPSEHAVRAPDDGQTVMFGNDPGPTEVDDREVDDRFSGIRDQLTIAVGYTAILAAGGAWALVTVLLRDRYPRLATQLMTQVLSVLDQLYTFLKVSFLLFVELGAFPLFCGCWLDICTLDLLNASWKTRVAFVTESPFTGVLLHWLVGILYMLYISLFISMLREVMRPGLFWFLRDPGKKTFRSLMVHANLPTQCPSVSEDSSGIFVGLADDPAYHPFRDLVEESLPKHARRVVLSAMIYAPLIVMMVWTPVQLCVRAAPTLFPLNLQFHDPYTEVPADIILFHICVPFTIDHFHPRQTVKSAVRWWTIRCGDWLGITQYIVPDRVPAPEDGLPAGHLGAEARVAVDAAAAAVVADNGAVAAGVHPELQLRRELQRRREEANEAPFAAMNAEPDTPAEAEAEAEAVQPLVQAHASAEPEPETELELETEPEAEAPQLVPQNLQQHQFEANVAQLVGMGFPEDVAVAGLRQQAAGLAEDLSPLAAQRLRADAARSQLPAAQEQLRELSTQGPGVSEPDQHDDDDDEDADQLQAENDALIAQRRRERTDHLLATARAATAAAVAGAGAEAAGAEAAAAAATQPRRPSFLVLRSIIFILLGWLSMVAMTSAAILLPTGVGRACFAMLTLPRSHDLYTYGLGCYCMWGCLSLVRYMDNIIGRHPDAQRRRAVALQKVKKWAVIGAKTTFLGAFWIGVIPFLIGLVRHQSFVFTDVPFIFTAV